MTETPDIEVKLSDADWQPAYLIDFDTDTGVFEVQLLNGFGATVLQYQIRDI